MAKAIEAVGGTSEGVGDAELEQWVAAYRNGDDSYRDRLIRAHLKVVKTTADVLASRCGKRNLMVDVEQEAFTAMIEAIDDAKEKLVDNDITSYIISTVRYRLRDYIARERCVYMPARTFRHKLTSGDDIKGVTFEREIDPQFWDAQDHGERTDYNPPLLNPVAPPDDVSPEFTEAMELAIISDEERKVIDLKIEGYKYRDYEAVLGLKRDKVTRIIERVRRRFYKHYA